LQGDGEGIEMTMKEMARQLKTDVPEDLTKTLIG
jgi:hypothetical protein